MPKTQPQQAWAYRVRIDGEDDAKAVAFFKTNCTKWLLVHHVLPHGNPHYHAYAEARVQQGNFSNKIKAHFAVAGGDYANKSCDSDRKIEYLSYLWNIKKGNKPRLVEYEGFSPLDVETYRENAKRVAEEFQVRMKNAKKSQYDVALLVMERFPSGKVLTAETIYEVTIDVLKQQHMMARPNHVKDIIATVMAYSDDIYARKSVKELTLRFFSPG